MFDNNSKFPKFAIYMLSAISVIMVVAIFFDIEIVATAYFVALTIVVVFLMLDKKYGPLLTNYKLAFFHFDLINLISIISIICYEFYKHALILNIFLISLIVMQIVMMVVDIVVIKNKKITPPEHLIIDAMTIGTMICILTYFFKVSNLFFAVDALIFEIAILVIKLMFNKYGDGIEAKTKQDDEKLEEIIHSAGENEGGVDA